MASQYAMRNVPRTESSPDHSERVRLAPCAPTYELVPRSHVRSLAFHCCEIGALSPLHKTGRRVLAEIEADMLAGPLVVGRGAVFFAPQLSFGSAFGEDEFRFTLASRVEIVPALKMILSARHRRSLVVLVAGIFPLHQWLERGSHLSDVRLCVLE